MKTEMNVTDLKPSRVRRQRPLGASTHANLCPPIIFIAHIHKMEETTEALFAADGHRLRPCTWDRCCLPGATETERISPSHQMTALTKTNIVFTKLMT